jgi:hypothetical protein
VTGEPDREGERATCSSCGEPVDPRQLVCTGCGARVALEQRPWAGDPRAPWAALLLAVIVLGAALCGFAIAELTSDEGDSARQAAEPAAGGAGSGDAGAGPGEEGPAVVSGSGQGTRSSTETAPPEETAPPAETAPASPNKLAGWPAGLRAHTVVLVTTSDGPAARRVAREAWASGLEAGLIRSDPYGLGSGLWIVFTGRFDTREGAVRQAAGLQERYPGAYPQLVQRSQ